MIPIICAVLFAALTVFSICKWMKWKTLFFFAEFVSREKGEDLYITDAEFKKLWEEFRTNPTKYRV